MKKIFFSIAVLFLCQMSMAQTTPTNAPKKMENRKGNPKTEHKPKKSAEERAVQYADQLKSTLSLSDAQYKQVLAVNTECITRKDALRANEDKNIQKTGNNGIHAYRVAEFEKIFTAEQMTAFKNYRKDKKGEGAERGNKNDQKKQGNKGKEKGKGHGKRKGMEKRGQDKDEDQDDKK